METPIKVMKDKIKKITSSKKENSTETTKDDAAGRFQKFVDFLIFLSENHAEEMARYNIKTMREMDIPLLKLFSHLTDEQLLAQSIKGMKDNIANLQDGSYLEKQRINLKLWEEDKLPGISRDSITPNDLVMIYALQKKGYFKFLPLYTTDNALTIDIMQAVEELNLPTQKDAFNMMFMLSKRAEEKAKKAAELLTVSEERLRQFTQNVKDYAIVMLDIEGNVISWGRGAEMMKGYTADEIMGKHFSAFYTKEELAKNEPANNLEQAVKHGRYEIEGLRKRKNGSTFWADVVITAIRADDGDLRGFTKITRDLTEKKEKEDKIKKLNKELGKNVSQLEVVNKELDAFSYSVSHDLRAPLRAIHGYSKILLEDYKDKLDDDGKHMMDSVMNNAVRMGQLIDDLLAFSRMGKKEMIMGPVDMTIIATSALKMIKSGQSGPMKANITLHPLLPITADYSLVEQVFTNLISNAIKYSSKSANPDVEIGSYNENGENIYYVKDNGVGFDMKYYDKLFGVFQRLHSTAEFDGTGVGLALVKRIVSKHGGRVWAEAEPGKGATFFFALAKNN